MITRIVKIKSVILETNILKLGARCDKLNNYTSCWRTLKGNRKKCNPLDKDHFIESCII